MVKRSSAFGKAALRQVRGTLGRFLSIFAITALGVAFFAGLRATGPDMRLTAEHYLQEQGMMDLRLLSTVGFNEEDIAAARGVEGVALLEPGFALDALAEMPGKNLMVKLHSYSEDQSLNLPKLLEGRLPEKSGECLADLRFIESGFSIGESFRLVSGGSDPITDSLATDEYTIVGVGSSPLYISVDRGASSVGSGQNSAFLLLPLDDFKLEVYTELALSLKTPKSPFDEDYASALEPVLDAFEAIGNQRSEIRFDEIRRDGGEELSDARQELEEGRQELLDAKRKIADAETELSDGRAEFEDAKKELEDGMKKLRDGEKKLEDAKNQLDDGRRELDDGWKAYNEGKAEFDQKMADAEKQIAEGVAEYNKGVEAYEKGRRDCEAGKA
ncbi:MAG: ABC transporter permease, partial [Christensenellaceae bacterium]|nr:ABC transporter permease [Christensenellaceae bacterium]